MEDLGVPLSYVIGVLEGDSFPLVEGESSIIIGTFEEGWGFHDLILVLFLALKYIEVCLFLFCFGLIGVLRAVMSVFTSLSRVSRDTSIFSTSLSVYVFSVSSCSLSSAFSSTILVSSFFPSCSSSSPVASPSPLFCSSSSLPVELIS